LSSVSIEAIDLMRRLLTNKEDRLSCRRYRDNDIRGRRTPFFVFPNDADDIKAHPFFEDIPWENLHLTTPPWLPAIKRDQDPAKWFDDEDQILKDNSELDADFNEPTAGLANGDAPIKRPRDKILRDPVTAPMALEARKATAFLGYEYRRPELRRRTSSRCCFSRGPVFENCL
jgi:protein-serine/threonine kinase